MFTKVNYELNGVKDCLFLGGGNTKENVKNKIGNMRSKGFKILSYYKVKNLK